MAEVFTEDDADAEWLSKAVGEVCPDIEADREKYDIVGFDMEPGDALIFSAWVLHGARGNSSTDLRRAALSTRWLGDDAIWDPRPGSDPSISQDDVSMKPGEPPYDENYFPELYRT